MSDEKQHPPQALISRQEADDLLRKGYPPEDQLRRFPLGDVLVSIPQVDPRYGAQWAEGKGGATPGHIERVFEGLAILLSDTPNRIVADWEPSLPFGQATFFEQTLAETLGQGNCQSTQAQATFGSREQTEAFYRVLALYHDIGKAIIVERHPLVGWHLIKDVYKERVETELYPFLLRRDYTQWANALNSGKTVDAITTSEERACLTTFNHVVRYHDYFGILGTGEGSLPVTVDLIGLRGADPAEAKKLFSTLLLITLADLYGSVSKIRPTLVEAYCGDWRMLCATIDNSKGDRAKFFESLREESQSPKATIRRLARLMRAAAPMEWQSALVEEKVEEIFKDATLSRLYPFLNNFAMFCKLDYCIAFTTTLMKVAKERGYDVTLPVNAMMTVLAELERGYGDLCKRSDGKWRRLGFEMAGLTRKPTTHKDLKERTKSKIGETIADLLLKAGGLGKEWAIRECTMWFMEE